ncbi:MAG: hypothetical protein DVS81_02315 [Candidatus Accumulibacter meliphilus]|jgi:hypothetical protein|uniref:Uncharacterized protein n=1 Tax=Candidatus Accumulibacter meliphilus TaxID=2211374 RepID=A0A369XV91_9PROT|nr:MAG: hypothetical protein DVS81_02315 [Candidatus Accumulibacter meliphilus]
MPVEIKELVIRVVVGDDRGGAGREGKESLSAASKGRLATANSEEIVQECVRQVLRILAKEKER